MNDGLEFSSPKINMGQFNPYANGLFFLVLFSSAVLAWIYVFNLINDGKKKYCYGIFSVILISHPLWVTQFYFSLQEAAIAIGFFVQVLVFILLFDVLLNNRTSTERWLELGMCIFRLCRVLPQLSVFVLNNPVPVSLLSGDRKPQIRFLGNHHFGRGNLYHKSFRM